MIFREGFQDENFVAFYNGNKFYTGQLDSNFTAALEKLISLRALAFGDIVEYLESIGVSDVNIDDTFDVASTFSNELFYSAADGEDYWNFDGFEIFPEYELAESFKKRKIRNYSESRRRSTKSMMFEAKGKKCYVVVELPKDKSPKLIGVFYNKKDAELAAYKDSKEWRNVIETTIQ